MRRNGFQDRHPRGLIIDGYESPGNAAATPAGGRLFLAHERCRTASLLHERTHLTGSGGAATLIPWMYSHEV
jgi:hypothetical protein